MFAETRLEVTFEMTMVGGQSSLVEFVLVSGDLLSVCGANGSGKTSLLSNLAGVPSNPEQEPPQRRYNGRLIKGHDAGFQADVHWIADRPGLGEALSIDEEWRFWQRILAPGRQVEYCYSAIAERVGLGYEPQQQLETLSAGERQKVALARLFLAVRPIWLLDEPDVHLDAGSRAVLHDWMMEHCAQGGVIVVASHYVWDNARVLSLDTGI